MKRFVATLLSIVLFSIAAGAAGYTAIPVNKNYIAVGSEAFGGLIGVSKKSETMGNSAFMDKNGNLVTDFDMTYYSIFTDGSYVYVKDITDKTTGIVLDRYIIFGKNGKILKTIQTVKDGQDLYPSYYAAWNNYIDDYYAKSELFDVAVMPFNDYNYNGGDNHIYAPDGTPIYNAAQPASIMIDRGVWIELLDSKEKRIGWVNKNTYEFTTETPDNPYIYCGGYGAVKNGNVYEVYNNEGELQFTYDGSKYECTVADLQFDKNGYAVVYDKVSYGKNKYGMIDTKGNIVLPLEYYGLSDTEDGVIRAVGKHKLYKSDTAYGLIDINGNVILDFQYAYITPFENGIAAYRAMFSRNQGGYIDTQGNVIAEGQYITDDNCLGKWGVYAALTGKDIEVWQSEDSIAAYAEMALYDKNGKRLTQKPYEYIGQFNEGLAPVLYNIDPTLSDPNNIWRLGYIDTTGKEVIPCEFRGNSMPIFKDGVTVLEKNGTQYIVHNPLMTHGVNAVKNTAAVMVNGQKVSVDAYNIDGYNYFKLRDVAAMLNGTEKQFDIGWNSAKGAIDLKMGKGYAGEISFDSQTSANARLNYPVIYQDGVLVNEFNESRIQTYGLTAYDICINGSYGNNFIKLRDIGKFFDFNISYDEVSRCISIDTTKSY